MERGVRLAEARPWPWPIRGAVEPERVALVLIDLQRDFLDGDGWFAQLGYPVEQLLSVVERANRLAAAARDMGATVIWTRQGNAADLSDLPETKLRQGELNGRPVGAAGPLGRGLVRGEHGWDLVDAADRRLEDLVLDKPGYSCFSGTDFDELLRGRGVDALVFAGVTANVCVLSTLLAAVDLGYECLLIEDAVGAASQDLVDSVVGMVAYQGGLFGSAATTDEFVAGSSREGDTS